MTTHTQSVGVMCKFCSGIDHAPEICPMVRAIEYYADGRIKRLEFGSRFAVMLPTLPFYPQPTLPTLPTFPGQWPVIIWTGNSNGNVQ